MSDGVPCIYFIFNNVKTCFPSVCCFHLELFQHYFYPLCSPSLHSVLTLFPLLNFQNLLSDIFELLNLGCWYGLELAKKKKVFTHPYFIFVNYWHLATPVAGFPLKILQQNSLESLLFSTWFLYYKVARKYQSYWNKKPITLMDQTFKLVPNADWLYNMCTYSFAQVLTVLHWNTNLHE